MGKIVYLNLDKSEYIKIIYEIPANGPAYPPDSHNVTRGTKEDPKLSEEFLLKTKINELRRVGDDKSFTSDLEVELNPNYFRVKFWILRDPNKTPDISIIGVEMQDGDTKIPEEKV